MANVFSTTADIERPDFQLSNRWSSVMLELLTLSATRGAASLREQKITSWIAGHDQGCYGLGIVGFDLTEIPWSRDEPSFDKERAFLMEAAARIDSEETLTGIDYSPSPETLTEIKEKLLSLIAALDYSDVESAPPCEWTYGKPDRIELCDVHGAIKHANGCILCN